MPPKTVSVLNSNEVQTLNSEIIYDQSDGGCEKWNIEERNVDGLMVLCSTTFERIY